MKNGINGIKSGHTGIFSRYRSSGELVGRTNGGKGKWAIIERMGASTAEMAGKTVVTSEVEKEAEKYILNGAEKKIQEILAGVK